MSTRAVGTSSEYFNLTLPGYEDDTDVDDLNTNFSLIDSKLYDITQDIAENAASIESVRDSVDGTVTGEHCYNSWRYCRIGKICQLCVNGVKSITANGSTTILQLPDGMWPPSTTAFDIICPEGRLYRLTILNTGEVAVYNYNSTTNEGNLQGTLTWLAK